MKIKHADPFPRSKIAPGLLGHEAVTVIAEPGDWGLSYRAEAIVEARGGKYVVTKLALEEVDGGPPIQRGELARVSVEPFIRAAASTAMRESPGEQPGWTKVGIPGPTDEFLSRVKRNGLHESDLKELAALYRWIRLQEGKPTAVLADELRMSAATVRRWVARAVDAGYLTQEERTK